MQGDLDRAQEASEEGLKLEGVEQFWKLQAGVALQPASDESCWE